MSAPVQAAWAIASALAFALMSAAIKFGYAHYGLFELVFWRNVLGAVGIAAWAVATGRRLGTPNWPMHLRRSAAGSTAMVLWFAALAALPLATAATLGNTSPLFAALGVAFLARRRGMPPDANRRLLYAAACCGFAGVLLALRPTLDGATLAGFAAGLGSGLLATFVYFEMRTLAQAGEPSWRVVFWFSTVSALVGLAGTLAGGGFAPHTPAGIGWIVAVAGFALIGQITMTLAFGGPATLLAANLQYTHIAFAAGIAAVAFEETLSLREGVGLAVIAASGAWATWATRRAESTAHPAPEETPCRASPASARTS
jgi:drug/metabolite transporter (DMT)-like permease